METEREELEIEGLAGVFVDEHDVGEKQPPRERVAPVDQAAQRFEIMFVRSARSANHKQGIYFSE